MLAMVPCEQKPATKQVLNLRIVAAVRDVVSAAAHLQLGPSLILRSDICLISAIERIRHCIGLDLKSPIEML